MVHSYSKYFEYTLKLFLLCSYLKYIVAEFDPPPIDGELLIQERYGTKQRVYVQPPAQPERIVICEVQKISKITTWLKHIFLPQGFPDSTSRDYIEYQIFDTAQAFCSTITGILATQEVMRGVGVGQITATPLAATMTWVLKDGCGHIGRIIFAYSHGSYLDAYCKTWRLHADILNDVAMVIELTLPYYTEYTTAALCVSTVFKAVVGVAGGATRSALTQHQAIRDNLADVTAKDAAQETAVNLIASVVAVLLLAYCGTSLGLFVFLILTHLVCNYCAVKSVCLKTFNPPRFTLALDTVLKHEQFLPPRHINYTESIFHMASNAGREYCCFKIRLGSSAKDSVLSTTQVSYLKKLLRAYKTKPFVPFLNLQTRVVNVLLKENAKPEDMLEGYYHGVLFVMATLAVNDINIPFMELTSVFSGSEWASARARPDGPPLPEMPQEPREPREPHDQEESQELEYELSAEGVQFLQQLLSLEWRRVKEGLTNAGWVLSHHQMVVDEWRMRAEGLFDDFPQEPIEPDPYVNRRNLNPTRPIAAQALVNGRWNIARNPTRQRDYIREWVNSSDDGIDDNDRVDMDDDSEAGPSGMHSLAYFPPSDDDDSYSD